MVNRELQMFEFFFYPDYKGLMFSHIPLYSGNIGVLFEENLPEPQDHIVWVIDEKPATLTGLLEKMKEMRE